MFGIALHSVYYLTVTCVSWRHVLPSVRPLTLLSHNVKCFFWGFSCQIVNYLYFFVLFRIPHPSCIYMHFIFRCNTGCMCENALADDISVSTFHVNLLLTSPFVFSIGFVKILRFLSNVRWYCVPFLSVLIIDILFYLLTVMQSGQG